MNRQLIDSIYNASGFDWIINFVKALSREGTEMPLDQVLIISRVLFAVVMIGFMGYFFDRMKQKASAKLAKTKGRRAVG